MHSNDTEKTFISNTTVRTIAAIYTFTFPSVGNCISWLICCIFHDIGCRKVRCNWNDFYSQSYWWCSYPKNHRSLSSVPYSASIFHCYRNVVRNLFLPGLPEGCSDLPVFGCKLITRAMSEYIHCCFLLCVCYALSPDKKWTPRTSVIASRMLANLNENFAQHSWENAEYTYMKISCLFVNCFLSAAM